MMVPRLSGFTTQTTQLIAGLSSSWPNFSVLVLPGVNSSCRSGEARPSRLSQKTCAVVTPKVSAPLPVRKNLRDLRQHARERRQLVDRARALHAVHHADHVVVDQVGADAGQVVHAPECRAICRCAAGPMPEICRMCGEFTVPPDTITSRLARDRGEVAAALELDADAALALEHQLAGLRVGLDPEVRPLPRLAQEGLRRRAAPAAAPRHLRIADAVALLAVEVGIEGEARLLRRLRRSDG